MTIVLPDYDNQRMFWTEYLLTDNIQRERNISIFPLPSMLSSKHHSQYDNHVYDAAFLREF